MARTIKHVTTGNITHSEMLFIASVGEVAARGYGGKFNPKNFNLIYNLDHGRITIAYDDDRPTGLMFARLVESVFDKTVRILRQELLYARPGSRASKMLLDDFIDFGKKHADHVICCIGEHTCIKGSSLEKLGFKQLESYYRLEVPK